MEINKELVRIAKDIQALSTDMSNERMTGLFLALESWALKKGTSLPASAPVATQILEGLAEVRKDVSGKMSLKGEQAVKELLKAMQKRFTMEVPPVPALVRKYGLAKIQEMFYSRTASKTLSVPEQHQKKIALSTLKLSDIGARIMGGMSKQEARDFLKKIGYTESQIKNIELGKGSKTAEIYYTDKVLWKLGKEVSFELSQLKHSTLNPSRSELEMIARKLGITTSKAKSALDTYNYM